MGQRVYAVRIGDKYGPHYEDYINSKIPDVNWIRKPFDSRVKLQWNKLWPMSLDIDEPVVVIDIDMLFIHDYMDAINYPIERGEFLSIPCWWGDTPKKDYKMNGGFQKYYPNDAKYIFDEFMSRPEYWTEYYIENKTTIGPVNGEQYFVEDMVRKKLNLKLLPESWVCKWHHKISKAEDVKLNYRYQEEWLYLDEEFHSQIRLVHFLNQESLDKEQLKDLESF